MKKITLLLATAIMISAVSFAQDAPKKDAPAAKKEMKA